MTNVSGDFCEHDWPGSGCRKCREQREANQQKDKDNG